MAMWVVDFLRQVRDAQSVCPERLTEFVQGAADGSVPDYQLSAFLMAVYQKGLSAEATRALTLAMRDSGARIDMSHVPGCKVDKHSTGGVGDKISLHLAPWVAACGLAVPMVAGRGLGHTGGTLDKLESIPGFRTDLSVAAFRQQVAKLGVCIMGQTSDFAPADRKFYALRDVTATVESMPLITASILAKKLAEGIDALVLDVKVGRGAFMKTLPEARALAASLVRVGRSAGVGVRALLTRMDAPLGRSIGNALEVRESIEVLQGGGPEDMLELTLALGAQMLVLGGHRPDAASARARLLEVRDSGAAWQKFRAMVQAQGGELACIDDASLLPQAPATTVLRSQAAGFIGEIDSYALGHAAMALGAGRSRADARVDPAVGIVLHHGQGAHVQSGEPLATVHHAAQPSPVLLQDMQAAFVLQPSPPAAQPWIYETI